jgi:glycosyltransferase involved in cell wall biosynthesis
MSTPSAPNPEHDSVVLSFVVIGYNEGDHLRAALESVRDANLQGIPHELIYVDGGSTDDSLDIAGAVGVDVILGGEQRRRAAENRNLGWRQARGDFVHFLDGDMHVHPNWPQVALHFLRHHDTVAAVCGHMHETSPSPWYAALQIDWAPREGDIRHCGGAALFRKSVLKEVDGFPEDVAYGEEPLLCWRIRNDLGLHIHQLKSHMVDHNLDYGGFGDYWRRHLRLGATYAEIAARCQGTSDPLWVRERRMNTGWSVALLAWIALIVVSPPLLRVVFAGSLFALVARKVMQTLGRGYGLGVAVIYGLHTYFCKLPIALGILRWRIRNRSAS